MSPTLRILGMIMFKKKKNSRKTSNYGKNDKKDTTVRRKDFLYLSQKSSLRPGAKAGL
jgi:hypothetical protein